MKNDIAIFMSLAGFFSLILFSQASVAQEMSIQNLRAGQAHFKNTQVVSADDLKQNLALLRTMPGVTQNGGVWGPGSAMWEVFKEDNITLFSGVIGYTELMHPGSAQGFKEHSKVFKDPVTRMQRTFDKLLMMVYGTLDEAVGLSIGLNKGHAYVTGKMPYQAGYYQVNDTYNANEYSALMLVHMSHWQGVYKLYEFLHGSQSPAFRDRFYADTVKFGLMMGLPLKLLPSSQAEYNEMYNFLAADHVFERTPATDVIINAFLEFAKIETDKTMTSIDQSTQLLSWLINPTGNLLAPEATRTANACLAKFLGTKLVNKVTASFETVTNHNLDPMVFQVLGLKGAPPGALKAEMTRKEILAVTPKKIFSQYTRAMERVRNSGL